MLGLKKQVIAAASVAALAFAPITPAAAAGLFLPWLLGRHLVAAAVGLATLPLAVASSASQPAAPYPPAPGYGGAPGYYPRPTYYGAPAPYYARPSAYYAGPQGYYRPAVSYAHSAPRYEPARGYYPPRSRYTGPYGAHVSYQSGRFAYRRR
jgi:hypothetical protein